MVARDPQRLLDEVAQAKARLGLGATAPVVSCYEAGREGFWLHRFLQAHGITNHVVDSSAIEVSRRQRRAKSDGLDVRKLLSIFEFIPLSFWYDAPLISRDRDRRHDPWLVYGSPSYSPAQWSSWISRA
jgi:hypothetical protein